jgi:probable HAF family extracellular repeat protein
LFEGARAILVGLADQESAAFASNLDGDVAGSAQNRNADWRAFAAKSGRNLPLVFLQTLGRDRSSAMDVNEVGGYAGWAHAASGPTHAALFARGQRPFDLGTLGGPQSEAHAVNDYFWATGSSDTRARHNAPTNRGPVKRAFLWIPESGRMASQGEGFLTGKARKRDSNGRYYYEVTLREGGLRRNFRVFSLDTFGEDINSDGTACGYARLYVHPAAAKDRAAVRIGGKMYDLNDVCGASGSEWVLTHAWGTNDSGTVVGRGMNLRTGGIRAFIARRVR